MTIESWRRGGVIGHGSTATVFAATDVNTANVFAVKTSELARSDMLQREQRILSALSSEHIIQYFGYEISSCSYSSLIPEYNLFLEYAAKGSLAAEIKKCGGRLNEFEIRSFTCDIVRGLSYLHSVGVVHCDIKSDNILICSEGQAKIADFGCARWEENELKLRGTPMFMAPEVARGEEQGMAADVWALGCTIIEMATGGKPWTDVGEAIAALHRIGFSDDVPEFPVCLSEEGKDFLSKCLIRDPRKRWTAQQLLQHPFIADYSIEMTKMGEEHDWITPKSILDQQMFLGSSSEEELQDEDVIDHIQLDEPLQRIQELFSFSDPNWTWNQDWINVRSVGSECNPLPVLQDIKAATFTGSVHTVVDSNSEEYEETMNSELVITVSNMLSDCNFVEQEIEMQIIRLMTECSDCNNCYLVNENYVSGCTLDEFEFSDIKFCMKFPLKIQNNDNKDNQISSLLVIIKLSCAVLFLLLVR